MLFQKKIVSILFLLVSTVAVGATRGEKPEIVSGACTATIQDLPRGGSEWVITLTQTGYVALSERDLGFPPFHTSTGGYAPTLTSSEHHQPVFTCTPDSLYVLVYQTERLYGGGETWRETRTLLYRKKIWEDSSQAEFIYHTPLSNEQTDERNFSIPLTNPGLTIRQALSLTGLLSQQDRVVLFGKFEIRSQEPFGSRISYAALDLSVTEGPATLFFESGPNDIANSESVCVTSDEMFFVQRIGSLHTLYQVDSTGNIFPKMFSWKPVEVDCGPSNATIILSYRSASNGKQLINLPSTGRGR